MNKKNVRKKIFETEEDDVLENDPRSSKILQNIHKKLDTSAALNGGFDRLLYKIDGIEQSQSQIVEKVDKIHEAIYNPDDGLFARISANKASQIESISSVEKKVVEIDTWKQQVSKNGETCEKETDVLQLKIQEIENSINNINSFQSAVFSAGKWLAAAVAGGIISIIMKSFFH